VPDNPPKLGHIAVAVVRGGCAVLEVPIGNLLNDVSGED
jgi:hypothetical protein